MEISFLPPLLPWLHTASGGALVCSLLFLTSELSRWCLNQTNRERAIEDLTVFLPVSDCCLVYDCLGHRFSQRLIPLDARGVQESNVVVIFFEAHR